MNLYKLAIGLKDNIKNNDVDKSKKTTTKILNNITSKKKNLNIIEEKIYNKYKKNKVINNILYDNNDDDEDIIKQKELINILKYQLNNNNFVNQEKKYIKSNITKAENKLKTLLFDKNKK